MGRAEGAPLISLAESISPRLCRGSFTRLGVRPLHTARGSYGPADPRQGQADLRGRKISASTQPQARISGPKMFHDRCGDVLCSVNTSFDFFRSMLITVSLSHIINMSLILMARCWE